MDKTSIAFGDEKVRGSGAMAGATPTFPREAIDLVPLETRRARVARSRAALLLSGPGWTALGLTVDLLTSVAAVILVALAHGEAVRPELVLLFPALVVTGLALRGVYASRLREAALDVIGLAVGAISTAAMLLIALELLVLDNPETGVRVGEIWLLGGVLIGAHRALLVQLRARARIRRAIGTPTLIVGAGIVGRSIARRLQDSPEYGLRPVGYLDGDPLVTEAARDGNLPVLGRVDDLERVLRATGAEHVILAFTSEPDHGLVPLVRRCDGLGVTISLVPRLFESISDRVELQRLGGLPLLGLRPLDPRGWQFRVKYALDRPFAALLLVLLSPIMLVAAIGVRLSSPGPIMFRQRRVGIDGTAFDLLKFRSMRIDPDAPSALLDEEDIAPGGVEGADRRTRFGRFLRRSAIDELPQLLNVLQGEMSLVGPRPERPEYVRMFERHHHRYADRHRVKSGITGWAQVHGLRGKTSLSDRLEWDNFYIENWSLWLDFKVLLMTFSAVLRSSGDA